MTTLAAQRLVPAHRANPVRRKGVRCNRVEGPRRRLQPPRGMENTYQRGALVTQRTARVCGVSGCDRLELARNLCAAHYSRMRKHGDFGPAEIKPHSRGFKTCTVDGCERKHKAFGHCDTHRSRVLRTGLVDVAPRRRQRCTFKECGQPAVGKGLCTGHYQQASTGRPLSTLRRTRSSLIRDAKGHKNCSLCYTWLPEGEFYPAKQSRDKLSSYCKRCDRNTRLVRNYGITVSEYERILAEQGSACAICGGQPKDGPSFHVDHDHRCCPERKRSCGRCIRGLLCEDCNRVLGMFGEEVVRFEAAIVYLRSGGRRAR